MRVKTNKRKNHRKNESALSNDAFQNSVSMPAQQRESAIVPLQEEKQTDQKRPE
jgi:hypothetical protein